jgi:hypothetical protein
MPLKRHPIGLQHDWNWTLTNCSVRPALSALCWIGNLPATSQWDRSCSTKLETEAPRVRSLFKGIDLGVPGLAHLAASPGCRDAN